MNKQQQEIIQKISALEVTNELCNYWEDRYQKVFENDLFLLSDKTKNVLLADEEMQKPITPFGDIHITQHLDKNDLIDEILLQSTIETVVRFLDACLDKVNFTPEVKQVIDQYRKIGVGIAGFEEYLDLKKDSSEIGEIDYLGNFISSNCYRASETLADEKGTCEKWDLINKHLRPKPFEYWINYQTKEVKNGLELSELFDENLIKGSNYEIIPRRNSHLLIFPADLEWQIWNDRDETAPETKIEELDEKINENLSKKDIRNNIILQKSNKNLIVLEEEKQLNIIPVASNNQIITNNNEQINPKNEILNFDDLPNLILQDESEKNEGRESFPAFQIGELIHIKNNDEKIPDKIYQVVDFVKDENNKTFRYTLSSGEELDEKLWQEDDMEHADVLHLLDRFNHTEYKVNLFVNAIIINEKQEILVEKIERKLILPGEQVLEAIELKEFLKNLMLNNYGIEITNFYETFVVEEIQTKTAETDLHLGYLLGVKPFQVGSNMDWLDLQRINQLFATDQHLATEYLNFMDRYQQSVLKEADKKVQAEIDKEMAIVPTEAEIQQRIDSQVALKLQEIEAKRLEEEGFKKEEIQEQTTGFSALPFSLNQPLINSEIQTNSNLNEGQSPHLSEEQITKQKEEIEQEIRKQFELEKEEFVKEFKQEIENEKIELQKQKMEFEKAKQEQMQKLEQEKNETVEKEDFNNLNDSKYDELEGFAGAGDFEALSGFSKEYYDSKDETLENQTLNLDEKTNNKIIELEKELELKEKAKQELEAELEKKSKEKEELDSLKQKITELTSQNELLQKEKDKNLTQKEDSNDLNISNKELEIYNELETLKQEKEDLTKTLQKELEAKKNLNQEIEKFKEERGQILAKEKDFIDAKETKSDDFNSQNLNSIEEIEAQKYQKLLDEIAKQAEQEKQELQTKIAAKEQQVQTLEQSYQNRINELQDKIQNLSKRETEVETSYKQKLIDYENKNMQKRLTQQEIEAKIKAETEARTKDLLVRQEMAYKSRLANEKEMLRKSMELENERKVREEIARRIAAQRPAGNRSPSRSFSTLKIMQKYSGGK